MARQDCGLAIADCGLNRWASSRDVVTNDAISPLFEAAIEATEEAIYNSLFKAETVRRFRRTVRALPIDSTVAILKGHALLAQ